MSDTLSENEDIVQDAASEDVTAYGLADSDIHYISGCLDENRLDEIRTWLENSSYPDIADLIEKLSQDRRHQFTEYFGPSLEADVFAEMEPEVRKACLTEMQPTDIARILADLDSDDALELLLNLESDFQQEIIHNLSAKMRLAIQEGLSFPEDSAGRLMQREFVAIPQFWTVGKTIDYMRAAGDDLPTDFFDVFVISPTYHVVGEIPLNRLVRARRARKLEDLALDSTHPIPASMDQEEVAHIFRREGLASAPVVDEDERLIGVITIDDIVDVIDEEAQEDFLKLAGVEEGDLYRAVLSTTGSRFRWLLINLFTAILASVVISFFDATIEEIVALAVLMPIVASMGGNAGTQALTVAVRAIATREISRANTVRILWKETLVGVVNGSAFAVIAGLVAGAWFQDPVLGGVIAMAMIINLIVAGLSGAGIPVLLHRLGSDPAVSSTVVLTTITDVVGFLAFLGLAAIFLI